MKMFNDTGNGWAHDVFNLCANSLQWAARKLDPITPGGMDYVKLNVILFCIILPLVLFGLVAAVVVLLWLRAIHGC